MDQNSQNNFDIIEAQIRECYGRVVWSHKTQEKCSDILSERDKRIKLWQVILSALTTTSVLTTIFDESLWGVGVAAVLSTVLLMLNSYAKGYNLGEISQKHSEAANELWQIRETYLSVLTDIKMKTFDVKQVQEKRDVLQEKLASIYMGAPRSISKAYAKASTALKLNEELTFSDEEIDLLLPQKLRKTHKET